MKKLIYLFLTVLIVSCSGEDSNSDEGNKIKLVGTWVGDFLDPENDEVVGNTTLILIANNTGSVSTVFSDGETFSSAISWTSTATTITFIYDDGSSDVTTYNFISDNQLEVTREDGFYAILDKVI